MDTSTGELAHLFHNVLGNESWYNPDATRNSTGCPSSDPYCVQNTSADGVTTSNLESCVCWSGTPYAPDTDLAWDFSTLNGYQFRSGKDNQFYAWAVRPGELFPLPFAFAFANLYRNHLSECWRRAGCARQKRPRARPALRILRRGE